MTETSPVLTIDCVKGGLPDAAVSSYLCAEACLKVADPASPQALGTPHRARGELWCKVLKSCGATNRPGRAGRL